MGAVNYYTSDYITLGLKPYDIDYFINDTDFLDFIRDEWHIDITDETEVLKAVYNEITTCYEDDYTNIKTALEKYNFWYFHIVIKPGYYEGFTIDIENNFPVAYDSYIDKREAQKEITQLKAFLIECAGMGLVECFPGWCTGYSDYTETIKAINEAVKEMREEVKTIPTWAQYERAV